MIKYKIMNAQVQGLVHEQLFWATTNINMVTSGDLLKSILCIM